MSPLLSSSSLPKKNTETGTNEAAFSALVGPEKTAEFLKYMEDRGSDKTIKFFLFGMLEAEGDQDTWEREMREEREEDRGYESD